MRDCARHALRPVLRGEDEDYLIVQFVDKQLASEDFLFLPEGDDSDTWEEVARIARTAAESPVGLQIEVVMQRGGDMS